MGRPIDADVIDVSGSGIRLRMAVPVPCGAPVEVNDGHLILAGEVCRCGHEPDGKYAVGLRISEIAVASDARAPLSSARS
jgi:hypothetical protein